MTTHIKKQSTRPSKENLLAALHARLRRKVVDRLTGAEWTPTTSIAHTISMEDADLRVGLRDHSGGLRRLTGKAAVRCGRALLLTELVGLLTADNTCEVREGESGQEIRLVERPTGEVVSVPTVAPAPTPSPKGTAVATDAAPESVPTPKPDDPDAGDKFVRGNDDHEEQGEAGAAAGTAPSGPAPGDLPAHPVTDPGDAEGVGQVGAAPGELPIHPLAGIFPALSEYDFPKLKDDIRVHGMREPVWLHEGQLIDGRHRCRACKELGISPPTREWDGQGSLLAFVVSLNLHRRHLSETQRAVVGARLKPLFAEECQARMHAGVSADPRANLPEGGRARDMAADVVHVSPRTVEAAAKVLRQGCPEMIRAVEADEVSVSAAADLSVLPHERQAEILALGPKEVKAQARTMRAKKKRESDLAKGAGRKKQGVREGTPRPVPAPSQPPEASGQGELPADETKPPDAPPAGASLTPHQGATPAVLTLTTPVTPQNLTQALLAAMRPAEAARVLRGAAAAVQAEIDRQARLPPPGTRSLLDGLDDIDEEKAADPTP